MGNNDLHSRFPDVGNLSIAILENLVEPYIGKDAIGIIRTPYDEQKFYGSIAKALKTAEERFKEEVHSDVSTALVSLAIHNMPNLAKATKLFVESPTDTTLAKVLEEELSAIVPQKQQAGVLKAVSIYLKFISEELVNLSETHIYREKLQTLTLLKTNSNLAEILTVLQKVYETNISNDNVPSAIEIAYQVGLLAQKFRDQFKGIKLDTIDLATQYNAANDTLNALLSFRHSIELFLDNANEIMPILENLESIRNRYYFSLREFDMYGQLAQNAMFPRMGDVSQNAKNFFLSQSQAIEKVIGSGKNDDAEKIDTLVKALVICLRKYTIKNH